MANMKTAKVFEFVFMSASKCLKSCSWTSVRFRGMHVCGVELMGNIPHALDTKRLNEDANMYHIFILNSMHITRVTLLCATYPHWPQLIWQKP